MLRANRFLGIHQVWWGGLLAPLFFYLIVQLGGGEWQWWWGMAAFLLAWTCVELCFFPRRLVIRQLALEESHAEAVRLAWAHDLALRDVVAPRHRRAGLSSRMITAGRESFRYIRGRALITGMLDVFGYLRGRTLR
ncbi:hypothetical protein SAMN04487955_101359 [Halomonas korlensis]|uniref:Uncharacterized protein n=2 Tax=Halomonas korlensis TaxID=463301 RepID=A0A1I7FB15_9GAMM|nr:hypothetical protein SAMN04487955_101359 [Halomonas korlensis]